MPLSAQGPLLEPGESSLTRDAPLDGTGSVPFASLPEATASSVVPVPPEIIRNDQVTASQPGDGRGGVGTEPVVASGNQSIDGLLAGIRWSGPDLTYSFPGDPADYGTPSSYPDPAPFNGFATLNTAQQNEATRAFGLVSSYIGLVFTPITETTSAHATIRLADSSTPATSYAHYPNTNVTGGDAFYGFSARNPVQGNYASGNSTLHEIGHTLGLKHGQDAGPFGPLPADQLDSEYSLMNYPTYIGSTEGFVTSEAGSSPQSYMMDDIAALQDMYGANFGYVGQSFTYTWSPVTGEEFINDVSQGMPYDNHILETVWTGGATSTYDFANYDASGTLDLRPGQPVDFSPAQLADLGYNGSPGPGKVFAQGNVYNALLHQGDTSTEVSALVAGNGDDTIYANDVFDTIRLGSGSDTVYAGAGGAAITGGCGTNTLVVPGMQASYCVTRQCDTVAVADLIASRGGTETLSGVRYVQFSDQLLDLQQPVAASPDPPPDVGPHPAHDPDVAAAGVDPLVHYQPDGQAEGRMAFL